MKKPQVFILLLLCCFSSRAQKDYSYSYDIQGLDVTLNKFFDHRGYSIVVHEYNVSLSEAICQDAKKKNGIKRKSRSIKITGFEDFPLIYHRSKPLKDGFENVATVFLYEQDSTATYIAFRGPKLDTVLYRQFITAYLNDMIKSGLYLQNSRADSIHFLDRKILLGEVCRFLGPRNVQCEHRGQINWSVHNTLEDAKNAALFQFYNTEAQNGKLISDESVLVTFEGEPTKARKVVWKIGGIGGYLAKEMDGSNKLGTYYIAVELGGKYIHAVMSHWSNDPLLENGLPPLLSEFMELKQSN